jgi:hypothetical protein
MEEKCRVPFAGLTAAALPAPQRAAGQGRRHGLRHEGPRHMQSRWRRSSACLAPRQAVADRHARTNAIARSCQSALRKWRARFSIRAIPASEAVRSRAVDLEWAIAMGKRSGRESRGHRQHSPLEFPAPSLGPMDDPSPTSWASPSPAPSCAAGTAGRPRTSGQAIRPATRADASGHWRSTTPPCAP